MRYLVRYWDGKNIINDLCSDDYDKIFERQQELKKIYEDVWYADAIIEMLVG